MRMATVLASGPTAGPPRRRARRALRERGGLTLPGPTRGFQRDRQSFDLTTEPIPLALQSLVFTAQALGFLMLSLDVTAQTLALPSQLLDGRLGIIGGALVHPPVMPESPRRYKLDPLTRYLGD